jgi:hypothetical protein
MMVMSLLETALRRLVPDSMRVRREMTVTLGERQRPEPDLLVVHAENASDPERTTVS